MILRLTKAAGLEQALRADFRAEGSRALPKAEGSSSENTPSVESLTADQKASKE
jgi:hypothetical protein